MFTKSLLLDLPPGDIYDSLVVTTLAQVLPELKVEDLANERIMPRSPSPAMSASLLARDYMTATAVAYVIADELLIANTVAKEKRISVRRALAANQHLTRAQRQLFFDEGLASVDLVMLEAAASTMEPLECLANYDRAVATGSIGRKALRYSSVAQRMLSSDIDISVVRDVLSRRDPELIDTLLRGVCSGQFEGLNIDDVLADWEGTGLRAALNASLPWNKKVSAAYVLLVAQHCDKFNASTWTRSTAATFDPAAIDIMTSSDREELLRVAAHMELTPKQRFHLLSHAPPTVVMVYLQAAESVGPETVEQILSRHLEMTADVWLRMLTLTPLDESTLARVVSYAGLPVLAECAISCDMNFPDLVQAQNLITTASPNDISKASNTILRGKAITPKNAELYQLLVLELPGLAQVVACMSPPRSLTRILAETLATTTGDDPVAASAMLALVQSWKGSFTELFETLQATRA